MCIMFGLYKIFCRKWLFERVERMLGYVPSEFSFLF
nr:MAG TPA: hypothetical protein [Caudoviricetes sp.]